VDTILNALLACAEGMTEVTLTARFDEYLSRLGARWYLYANASNGFKDFLVWLASASARAHPTIVMPSYIPAKLYRAALAAGYAVRFYEVHDDCRFDVEEVERQIDVQTLALFHVHYFGFATGISEMRALANRRGIALIEDCALTIGATDGGRELGTYGDVALFSMRKMLLYPEGGALVVSDRYREFRPSYDKRVSSCYSLPRYLRYRAKYAYVRVTGGADPLRLVRPALVGYMDGRAQQTLSVKMISPFTQLRLRYVDLEAVVRRRRENYKHVLARFPRSTALQPLRPDLPDGCTPYSFPMLVAADRRDALRDALLRDGTLPGSGWPESPFDPALLRTRALSDRLLELPIHHGLTRRQLDRSLDCLERTVAREDVYRYTPH
jgi:dTDP-4-amino-4,6-dideoxygalactose transaminase